MERVLNLNIKFGSQKIIWPAIILIFYYTIVILLSYNFPISDDFALLDFVNKIVNYSDINKSLELIYAQHNEHRIVTTKLVYLLDYWFFGEINFRRLALIGNLFHLGTFYIFIKHQPQKIDQKSHLAIFTACLIFQFGSAESIFWSMAAISNYLVLMTALLTLSLLSREPVIHYILAIVFGILAVFTHGNGILVPFIAVVYLMSQKRYYQSILMFFLSLMIIFIYFYEYQSPHGHSNPIDAIKDAGWILIYAISFTGSAFSAGTHPSSPLITGFSTFFTLTIGLCIWVITFYGFYRKIYRDGNIFIWFNFFIILTAIITGMSRINFGLWQATSSRYHIYSNLAIISTIMIVLQYLDSKKYDKHVIDWFCKILAIFSILYLTLTLIFVPYFYLIVYSPIRSGEIIFPNKEHALEILYKARINGVFSVQSMQHSPD